MLIVFNKQKIITYVISVMAVIVLFVMPYMIASNNICKTSSTIKDISIYNVESNENECENQN